MEGKPRCVKTISLSAKMEIIERFKFGASRNELIEEFQVPRSTLSRILANADKLEQETWKRGGETKRLKRPKQPQLEEWLVQWVEVCGAKKVAVSGQGLKQKAVELAGRLGIEGFAASNGWLSGFKKRNAGICFNKRGHDGGSARDMEVCYSWLPPLEHDDQPLQLVLNDADETDFSGSESSSLQPINLCGISIAEDDANSMRKRSKTSSLSGSERDGISEGDKCSLWAKLWECKLRKLPAEQGLHAEKLIHEVLYEATLGNLSRKCSLNVPTITGNS